MRGPPPNRLVVYEKGSMRLPSYTRARITAAGDQTVQVVNTGVGGAL